MARYTIDAAAHREDHVTHPIMQRQAGGIRTQQVITTLEIPSRASCNIRSNDASNVSTIPHFPSGLVSSEKSVRTTHLFHDIVVEGSNLRPHVVLGDQPLC